MCQIHKTWHLSIGVMLALLSTVNYALPEDRKEKIYIIADSSVFNYKTGINVFEGHVKADQGTTHLLADKVITKSNARHEIQEVIAYGIHETAQYATLPKRNEPVWHANAKIIKYYPIQSNVVLEGNVHIVQGENNFEGQQIFYNMLEETITVPPHANGRAVLVYNPDN